MIEETTATVAPAAPLPDGEYAIVEVLGHRTYVGRVSEVERFGVKLMSIEPVFKGDLLPAVLVGGSSLYQLTWVDKHTAARRAPTHDWQLPTSVRATMPEAALPAPDESDIDASGQADDDGMPF